MLEAIKQRNARKCMHAHTHAEIYIMHAHIHACMHGEDIFISIPFSAMPPTVVKTKKGDQN